MLTYFKKKRKRKKNWIYVNGALSVHISVEITCFASQRHRQKKRMYSFELWTVCDLYMYIVVCKEIVSLSLCVPPYPHLPPSPISFILCRLFVILFTVAVFFFLFLKNVFHLFCICDRFDCRSVFPMNGKLFDEFIYFDVFTWH